MTRVVFTIVLLLLAPFAAGAQTWEDVGPFGGRATAVAVDPIDEAAVYAAVGWVVVKSADGGASWNQVYVHPRPFLTSIRALGAGPSGVFAVAHSSAGAQITPCRLGFVGCESSLNIARSRDGGTTWAKVYDDRRFGALSDPDFWYVQSSFVAFDPTDADVVYVGGRGAVLKSTDGGDTWKAIGSGLPRGDLSALAFDPTQPSIAYVARRTSRGTPGGVYKSGDGAATFVPASMGLPDALDLEVRALLVDPATPSTLWAGTSAGLFRTVDGAGLWTQVGAGLPTPVAALALDASRRRLYAGTVSSWTNGVFVSEDGGDGWTPADADLRRVSARLGIAALAVAPSRADTVYAGTVGLCVARSGDAGGSWSVNAQAGCVSQPTTHLAIVPASTTIYASSESSYVYRSDDRGDTWTPRSTGLTMPTALAVDPHAPSTVYAADGSAFAISVDRGDTWSTVPVDFASALAIVVDPIAPGTLSVVGAASQVYRSTDGGLHWTGTPSDTRLKWFGPIEPSTPATFWALDLQGHPVRSTDLVTWTRRDRGLPLPTPYTLQVRALAADPRQPGRLWAAIPDEGIYETSSAGGAWTLAVPTQGMRALAVDPISSSLFALRGEVRQVPDGGEESSVRAYVANGSTTTAIADALPGGSDLVADDTGETLYTFGWEPERPDEAALPLHRMTIVRCNPPITPSCVAPLDVRDVRYRRAVRAPMVSVRARLDAAVSLSRGGKLFVSSAMTLRTAAPSSWAADDCRSRRGRLRCANETTHVRVRRSVLTAKLRAIPTSGLPVAPLTVTLAEEGSPLERTGHVSRCTVRPKRVVCRP